MLAMAPKEQKFDKIEVVKETIKGDTAIVTLKAFKDGKEDKKAGGPPVDLLKVDGKWLVDMKKKAGM